MENLKRYTALGILIIISAFLVGLILSFVFSGLKFDIIMLSTTVFVIGMILSIAGAMGMIVPFSKLKSKLKKSPVGTPVDFEYKNAYLWRTLFISGIIIFSLSIYMVL